MKTCTINMGQVKNFNNFREQYSKMRECTQEEKERVYDYLDKMGATYTVDRNPSPEKIARIKEQIAKNKRILGLD